MNLAPQVILLTLQHVHELFGVLLKTHCSQAQKLTVSLSFLNATPYSAMLVRDQSNDPMVVKIEKTLLTSSDLLQIELANGGGFIGQFSPRRPRLSVPAVSR